MPILFILMRTLGSDFLENGESLKKLGSILTYFILLNMIDIGERHILHTPQPRDICGHCGQPVREELDTDH